MLKSVPIVFLAASQFYKCYEWFHHCGNGTFLDPFLKCDGIVNCPKGTVEGAGDEDNCHGVTILPSSYNATTTKSSSTLTNLATKAPFQSKAVQLEAEPKAVAAAEEEADAMFASTAEMTTTSATTISPKKKEEPIQERNFSFLIRLFGSVNPRNEKYPLDINARLVHKEIP